MTPFLLNLPYTLIGFVVAAFSGLYEVKFNKKHHAFVLKVNRFWWAVDYLKNARAMTIGQAIILGPKLLKNDLEHELIHVKQVRKYLLIYPFLYYLELFTKGYRNNRFEAEAYRLSKSIYMDKAN